MTASSPEDPRLDQIAVAALQNALAAEHAAIWCYSLAVAFLSGDDAARAREDERAHRELRNQVEETLTRLGAPAVSAQPAYATPRPVTDGASAAALAVVAETDALAAWRSVLERTDDRALRQAALDTLTAGTLRCARWRVAVGERPTIPIFPGRP
jgi:sugar phosphate isomerase/epimerase